jgi:hypothetical protein
MLNTNKFKLYCGSDNACSRGPKLIFTLTRGHAKIHTIRCYNEYDDVQITCGNNDEYKSSHIITIAWIIQDIIIFNVKRAQNTN